MRACITDILTLCPAASRMGTEEGDQHTGTALNLLPRKWALLTLQVRWWGEK